MPRLPIAPGWRVGSPQARCQILVAGPIAGKGARLGGPRCTRLDVTNPSGASRSRCSSSPITSRRSTGSRAASCGPSVLTPQPSQLPAFSCGRVAIAPRLPPKLARFVSRGRSLAARGPFGARHPCAASLWLRVRIRAAGRAVDHRNGDRRTCRLRGGRRSGGAAVVLAPTTLARL